MSHIWMAFYMADADREAFVAADWSEAGARAAVERDAAGAGLVGWAWGPRAQGLHFLFTDWQNEDSGEYRIDQVELHGEPPPRTARLGARDRIKALAGFRLQDGADK